MACSKYASTKQIINAARVSRLLLDPCTELLRDVLRHYISETSFPRKLQIYKFSIKPHLNASQGMMLYPKHGTFTGSYQDFDISVLYLLLRNMSGINKHLNGWGVTPIPNDRSISANIDRIRKMRNEYGHVSQSSMSDSQFNSVWQEVRNITSELVKDIGLTTDYLGLIDRLEHETIDPVQEHAYLKKHNGTEQTETDPTDTQKKRKMASYTTNSWEDITHPNGISKISMLSPRRSTRSRIKTENNHLASITFSYNENLEDKKASKNTDATGKEMMVSYPRRSQEDITKPNGCREKFTLLPRRSTRNRIKKENNHPSSTTFSYTSELQKKNTKRKQRQTATIQPWHVKKRRLMDYLKDKNHSIQESLQQISDRLQYLNLERPIPSIQLEKRTSVSIRTANTDNHDYSSKENVVKSIFKRLEYANLYLANSQICGNQNLDQRQKYLQYFRKMHTYLQIRNARHSLNDIQSLKIAYDTEQRLHRSFQDLDWIQAYELLLMGCDLTIKNAQGFNPLQILRKVHIRDAVCTALSAIQLNLVKEGISKSLLHRTEICSKDSEENDIVLVAYIQGNDRNNIKTINGLRVIWQDVFKKYNDNNRDKYLQNHQKDLSNVDKKEAMNLFKNHSNLTMISMSQEKHDKGTRKCVNLFCRTKSYIPFAEKKFPKKIRSWPVHVYEGTCFFGNDKNVKVGKRLQKNFQPIIFGTIGGFVELPQNKMGLITCAHVVYDEHDLEKASKSDGKLHSGAHIDMYIPSSDTFEECGIISKGIFRGSEANKDGVDVALVNINSDYRNRIDDTFPIDAYLETSDQVLKYGASTGYTVGKIRRNVHARPENLSTSNPFGRRLQPVSITMLNSLEVENPTHSFFEMGDSGSFVYKIRRKNLECVGMAIGISSYKSCIVSPIETILSSLELNKLSKIQFPNSELKSIKCDLSHIKGKLQQTETSINEFGIELSDLKSTSTTKKDIEKSEERVKKAIHDIESKLDRVIESLNLTSGNTNSQ